MPAKQSLAQELTRGLRNFGRAALGSWRVQPAEPHDSPVAERDIEPLIDADGLNASGRPPASRPAYEFQTPVQSTGGLSTPARSETEDRPFVERGSLRNFFVR